MIFECNENFGVAVDTKNVGTDHRSRSWVRLPHWILLQIVSGLYGIPVCLGST